jgi:SH3-like domain-containing protein
MPMGLRLISLLRPVALGLILGLVVLAGPGRAEEPKDDSPPEQAAPGAGGPSSAIKTSGLPVPRFVSLRSAEVNARTGPSTRYPVDWVFVRRGMPVEVTAEFDTWRRIRDWEGSEGWVHQSMLSGKRSVVVRGEVRTLRKEPGVGTAAVARVEPGVIGPLMRCKAEWCEVDFTGYRGWLRRSEVWGVQPDEKIE